jgi:hypothetical protein
MEVVTDELHGRNPAGRQKVARNFSEPPLPRRRQISIMQLGPADAAPLLESSSAECELPVPVSAAQDQPSRPVLDLPVVKERTTFQLWRAFVLCLVAVFPPLFTMSLFTEELAAANSNFNYVRQYVTPFFFSIFLTSFVEVVCREFLSGTSARLRTVQLRSPCLFFESLITHCLFCLLILVVSWYVAISSSAVAARLCGAVGFPVVRATRSPNRVFSLHDIYHCRRSVGHLELV